MTFFKREVHIVMIGARGAGKTTLMSLTTKALGELMARFGLPFCCEDERAKEKIAASLEKLRGTPEGELEVGSGIEGTSGSSTREESWRFSFLLKMGHGFNLKVVFHDYPGGFLLERDGRCRVYLKKLLQKGDIFLIAADAPFLMEQYGDYNGERNCCRELLSLLCEGYPEKPQGKAAHKTFIIAPTRAEYYTERSRTGELLEKLQRPDDGTGRSYEKSLLFLKERGFAVALHPVKTIGGVEFCGLRTSESGACWAAFHRTAPGSAFAPEGIEELAAVAALYALHRYDSYQTNTLCFWRRRMKKQDDRLTGIYRYLSRTLDEKYFAWSSRAAFIHEWLCARS